MTKTPYATVKIPVKPYLKKFIISEVGAPIFTPGNHAIQKFLVILLEKKIYKYNFTALNQNYTDTLEVRISMSSFHKLGYSISQQNVVVFNDFVEELFDQALYNYCQDYVKFNRVLQEGLRDMASLYKIRIEKKDRRRWFQTPRYKDALHAFAAQIGLEVEVDTTFENLKKMEWRARKRIELVKKNSQPVPQLKGQLLLRF